ncbi:MAG: hypothetical protein AAFV43_07415 [Planctomycetota bacterium]
MTRYTLTLVLLIATPLAHAGVEALHVSQVDNGGVVTEFRGMVVSLENTVTNDLAIDFTGTLGGLELLIELDNGAVFNAPPTIGGGDTAPLGVLTNVFPVTRFDTFVGLGATTSDAPDYVPTSIWGGAIDLGGDASAAFDSDLLDVVFASAVGESVADQSDYPIGRVTLSDDASGQLKFFGSTLNDGIVFEAAAPIAAGVIGPPRLSDEGDFDNSGAIDNDDLNLLLNHWGDSSVPAEWVGYFTPDVNNDELALILSGWGASLTRDTGIVATDNSGDFDGDGFVNLDYKMILSAWGGIPFPGRWVNWVDDGLVNYNELNYLLADWGNGTFAVPEPTAAVLVLVAAAAFARRR